MKLQNLINPELALTVKSNAVTLEEAQTEKYALREVTVHGLPNNVFVFSTDKKITVSTERWEKKRNQFLNNENDKIHKTCDAVIFHYDDSYLDIVFCELKSTNPEPIQYETQLINTKLFVDYLVTLFNQFYKEEGKISLRNRWYILFYVSKKRPVKVAESLRDKIQIRRLPVPEIEKMQHYPENIIKYPCLKMMYNHIEWKDLIASVGSLPLS
jgi:hypothetical protein